MKLILIFYVLKLWHILSKVELGIIDVPYNVLYYEKGLFWDELFYEIISCPTSFLQNRQGKVKCVVKYNVVDLWNNKNGKIATKLMNVSLHILLYLVSMCDDFVFHEQQQQDRFPFKPEYEN